MHSALAYEQISKSHATFIICAAVIVGAMLVWTVKRDKVPGEFWCYILYCFGAIFMVRWCFPDRATADELGERGLRILQWIAGSLIIAGLLLHLLLWRLGRLAPQPDRKHFIYIVLLVVPAAILYQVLESTTLPSWSIYLIGCAVVFPVCFVLLTVSAKKKPGYQIIQLMKQQQYEQAIELAESLAPEELTFDLKHNLAACHYMTGETDKARQLFEEVKATPDVPSAFGKLTDDWLEKLDAEANEPQQESSY